MKVAHLDTARTWRGGQNQVLLLMRGLATRGHDVLLLAPDGPLAERARREGLATRRWTPHGELDVVAALTGTWVLRGFAPAIVHCHSAHAHALGVPAARLAGVPAVVVSRRVDFTVGGNALSRLKYRFGVDRYLCISRGVEEAMLASGIPRERLARVPSGIEPPADPPPDRPAADVRALIGVPPGARIAGTVAALAPHKNHADLLRAAAEVTRVLADVHFVWIGDGECRHALERQRAALGLDGRVHLLGFRLDARDLARQFTVFALSSSLEGLCTSLLDAQWVGVAIVATAVGGVPEVITDGVSGRLVPGGDSAALARALIEALERPELRADWARGGRESVRAFGVQPMVERTLEVYRQALGERRTGS